MAYFKQFGGKVTAGEREKYSRSPNWDGRRFTNLEETTMDVSLSKIPGLLHKQMTGASGRMPERPIPVESFDRQAFREDSPVPKAIWYGHSVLLLRIGGMNILIDPMFGPNASPIAPFPTRRFSEHTLDIIDQLPDIDLMLLSHDHYDHLDYESLRRLRPKIREFFTALGAARHLRAWGISDTRIREFDWWDQADLGPLRITFTPSRHFSGRGISDRARSLWGGWALHVPGHSVYFSGDGGYGNHFREVGNRLGPFDFAFMECGQYYHLWHAIHMYPEESIQAALDAGVRTAMPVHWGAFSLAFHPWDEPVERFSAAATDHLSFILPRPGDIFTLDENYGNRAWWV